MRDEAPTALVRVPRSNPRAITLCASGVVCEFLTLIALLLQGHLPFIDEREAFVAEYLEFLDAVDGKKTSRELLIDPSLKSIRGTSI